MLIICSAGEVQAQVVWDESLDQEQEWYSGNEAIRIADNLLVYQTDIGGWPKNINMAEVLSESEIEQIEREQSEWGTELGYSTIDNGATHTQLRYLARVYLSTGLERFKESFIRGLEYLLNAQYESGGWPQYYPIREGYYENITFNDGAMIGAMNMLREVVEEEESYSFVESPIRERSAEAIEKGINSILTMQIMQNGEHTSWCAQYNPETLEPAWARAYEPPSFSGSESVGIVRFLMSIDDPDPEIIDAIEGAVEWFRRVAIYGYRYERFTNEEGMADRRVVADSEAGPIWARFYQLDTNRPIFLGRDSVVRFTLAEIEQERRNGYSYYGNWANELITEDYNEWRSRNNLNSE